MTRCLITALAAIALALLAFNGTAAVTAKQRIVDQTFLCNTVFGQVRVATSPKGSLETLGAQVISSGYARVTSGPDLSPLSDLAVASRPGYRTATIHFPGSVYASTRRCASSRAAVPLGRAGFARPPTAFLSAADCTVRGRVLIRVRAVLNRPALWRRLGGELGSAFIGTKVDVDEAQIAVRRARTGSPMALAQLLPGGLTRLWASPSCR